MATALPRPSAPPPAQPTFSTLDLFTVDFSAQVADTIVAGLDRYQLYTLDDLATNERLQVVVTYTCDNLPMTLRTIVRGTIGREAFERCVLELLIHARGRIPIEHRHADLRVVIREFARSPWLSNKMRDVYTSARSGLGSLVSSYTPTGGLTGSLSGGLSGAWAKTQNLVRTARAPVPALPVPSVG
ncbi:MAG: hypothetical protein ACT4N2_06110 [Hyphomicrobium sp.]